MVVSREKAAPPAWLQLIAWSVCLTEQVAQGSGVHLLRLLEGQQGTSTASPARLATETGRGEGGDEQHVSFGGLFGSGHGPAAADGVRALNVPYACLKHAGGVACGCGCSTAAL